MALRPARSYRLTPEIVATSIGAGVMCLSAAGLGRSFRLHASRPGPELNQRIARAGRVELPGGTARVAEPATSALVRVDVMGPLEQRAGYHDPCGGWSDGHDAVADRLCAAFAEGDVLLNCEGPGGAAAGIQQGTARVLAAKAKFGRRCTGWINEEVASAHAWWLFAVCDEILLPGGGRFGSIGARAGHLSIAGAMAKAGEVMTYFADPPEKVALAPELPLSEVGKARGNRDVSIIAGAFRAAVCASPVGQRYGLTPAALIALGADMLTGQAAVDAGLADGIATEDEVIAYALQMAERSTKTSVSAQIRARGEKMDEQETRAEDEAPPSEPREDDAPEAGRDIPTKCATCDVENTPAAKFCMGCGASMSTAPTAEKPAARLSLDAPYAELAGVSADASMPVIKAGLVPRVDLALHVMRTFDVRDPDRARAAFDVMKKDAARLPSLERKLADGQEREKLAIGHKIVALGIEGYPRGDVLEDVLEGEKRVGVRLTREYREMSLAAMDEKYKRLSGRASKPRSPFEPDRAGSEAAAKDAAKHGGLSEAQRIERAKTDPAVLRMFNAPGNTHSLDAIATQYLKTLDTLAGGK